MPSAYLQWQFHSGERVVARGPLVCYVVISPEAEIVLILVHSIILIPLDIFW